MSRVGEHIALRKWLGLDGPDHRLDGTRFVSAGGGLGWWLSKTHESLDGLGDGMILLQEAQASTSAMMGKRMDGIEERVQRLVAGLDGVRAAHPELDGTILAFEALQGKGEALQALETLVAESLYADHETSPLLAPGPSTCSFPTRNH